MASTASLPSLPAALKLEILRFCLHIPSPITAYYHICSYSPLLVNLLLTSKELHNLAASVYYGENTFFIYCCSMRHLGGNKVFRFPNSAYRKLVRRLEVDVAMTFAVKNVKDYFLDGSDIATLVRPRYAQRLPAVPGDTITRWSNARNRHSSWQVSFPNLQEVTINVVLTHCLGPQFRAKLEELPEKARWLVKAKNVEMYVFGVDRATWFPEELRCKGDCKVFVKRVLGKLIKGDAEGGE